MGDGVFPLNGHMYNKLYMLAYVYIWVFVRWARLFITKIADNLSVNNPYSILNEFPD